MKLNLTFPNVSIGTDPSFEDTEVMWLLPYIPNRPFAVPIAMPAVIAAQMAKSAELQLQIDGRNFYLLPLSSARKNEPELAVAKAAASLANQGWKSIAVAVLDESGADYHLLAGYVTDLVRHHFTMKTKEKAPLDASVCFVVDKLTAEREAQVFRGIAMGKARAFMRTIIDMPANKATPSGICFYTLQFLQQEQLEDVIHIKQSGRSNPDVARMGAFLGVAQGSEQEPAVFFELAYGMEGFDKVSTADINFVGKGVTFDSGGISIKPSANMHHMKGDMGGAAAAIAAVLYAAMAKLPLKLRAFTPMCENMPSHNALKPGDVVKAYDGRTIEVIDTDAEGRLILADALAYANEFPAELTVDMATLTGACREALGGAYAGLFSDNDELCSEFTAAGRAGKDKVWRLPMTEDYAYMLQSKVADVSHLERTNGGGAINGAFFLKYFVKQKDRWVHLDIANVSGDNACATGRPLSLLAKLLDKRAKV